MKVAARLHAFVAPHLRPRRLRREKRVRPVADGQQRRGRLRAVVRQRHHQQAGVDHQRRRHAVGDDEVLEPDRGVEGLTGAVTEVGAVRLDEERQAGSGAPAGDEAQAPEAQARGGRQTVGRGRPAGLGLRQRSHADRRTARPLRRPRPERLPENRLESEDCPRHRRRQGSPSHADLRNRARRRPPPSDYLTRAAGLPGPRLAGHRRSVGEDGRLQGWSRWTVSGWSRRRPPRYPPTEERR